MTFLTSKDISDKDFSQFFLTMCLIHILMLDVLMYFNYFFFYFQLIFISASLLEASEAVGKYQGVQVSDCYIFLKIQSTVTTFYYDF